MENAAHHGISTCSAADAQHIAAEFVGRYMMERAPLPAVALSTDTSALTAIGND
jgi:D-sedoheptulose 7-phosphate isomerase